MRLHIALKNHTTFTEIEKKNHATEPQCDTLLLRVI